MFSRVLCVFTVLIGFCVLTEGYIHKSSVWGLDRLASRYTRTGEGNHNGVEDRLNILVTIPRDVDISSGCFSL